MGLTERPAFRTPDPKACARNIDARVKDALKALEYANKGPQMLRKQDYLLELYGV